jgi:hypothetical protein
MNSEIRVNIRTNSISNESIDSIRNRNLVTSESIRNEQDRIRNNVNQNNPIAFLYGTPVQDEHKPYLYTVPLIPINNRVPARSVSRTENPRLNNLQDRPMGRVLVRPPSYSQIFSGENKTIIPQNNIAHNLVRNATLTFNDDTKQSNTELSQMEELFLRGRHNNLIGQIIPDPTLRRHANVDSNFIRRFLEEANSIPCTLERDDTINMRLKFYRASKDDETEDCTVCLNKIKLCEKIVKLDCCKGYFHFDCLNEWTKYKQDCPLCRKKIESK